MAGAGRGEAGRTHCTGYWVERVSEHAAWQEEAVDRMRACMTRKEHTHLVSRQCRLPWLPLS